MKTVWSYKPNPGQHIGDGAALSGSSGGYGDEVNALRALTEQGHMIVDSDRNPRGVWCGRVRHDDAQFAESGTSMAAYYENGDATGEPVSGRWWEPSVLPLPRRYYDPAAAALREAKANGTA